MRPAGQQSQAHSGQGQGQGPINIGDPAHATRRRPRARLDSSDPDQLKVPATGKGGSRTLSVQIPAELADHIQAVVESGRTPWRTASDLIRYAAHSLMGEVSQVWDSGPGRWRGAFVVLQQIARLVRHEEFRSLSAAVFRDAEDRIRQMLQAGDIGQARRVVAEIRYYCNAGSMSMEWEMDLAKRVAVLGKMVEDADMGRAPQTTADSK